MWPPITKALDERAFEKIALGCSRQGQIELSTPTSV
jgi:hypothetical protein